MKRKLFAGGNHSWILQWQDHNEDEKCEHLQLALNFKTTPGLSHDHIFIRMEVPESLTKNKQ